MALQVASTPPPHPIPDTVREKAHEHLDELLNAHGWDQQRRLQDSLIWDYGKVSHGHVYFSIEGAR